MSAEAVGWVFRNSPYSGDTLVIHLAMADVANDTYKQRFWMPVADLATKARCSEKTVQRATKQMERDGMIERLKAARGRGNPAEYRLLFPERNAVNDDEKKGDILSTIPTETATSTDEMVDICGTPPYIPKSNQDSPVGEPPTVEAIRLRRATYPAEFESAWKAYPRSGDKRRAYRAWRARVMDAKKQGVTAERRMDAMVRASENYARVMAAEGRATRHMKQADTFFGPDEPWREFVKVNVEDMVESAAPWSASRANG